MSLPYGLQVLVAFTTPATSLSASWEDLTDRVVSFSVQRGRESMDPDPFAAGQAHVVLDNRDGRFNPDLPAGPYYTHLRPNRRVRITAQETSSSPVRYLFSGYADTWRVAYPGGASSVVELQATDYFKLLNRRTNTGRTTQEQADARITAILTGAGVPAAQQQINPAGYAARTLVANRYDKSNTLQNLQEAAQSDGGQLFVDGQGRVVFQTTRYRTDNPRATGTQGTFGNWPEPPATDAAISVESDIDPTVDDSIMANRITVTDGRGKEWVAEDTAAQAEDGLLALDLGTTLLRSQDGPDRAQDVLLLRKDPGPRLDSLTIDALTAPGALAQALDREISDRIALSVIPPGLSNGNRRRYYVEGVRHEVVLSGAQQWLTSFALSYGGVNTGIART